MRKNFGPKPYMYPMPVLIIAAYDENGVPNAMNAAWGCMADSDRIGIYVTAAHKTMKNILSSGAFTVSIADAENMLPADYVGIVSGNDVPDKLAKTGWHCRKSEFVNAPLIDELPMTLECRMIGFDKESELLTGEIVNISADEKILTCDKIDLNKFSPITYDPVNHDYIALGKKVGNAFADGKKLI